jgi:acyl-CoA thioester hydrolase
VSTAVKPLLVEWTFPIRTYDIDFALHVSNIVYIRWLEDLRLEMMSKYWPLSELLSKGQAPVLRSTTIFYKQPITILDKVRGHMWMSEMENLRMTLQLEYLQTIERGEVICEHHSLGWTCSNPRSKNDRGSRNALDPRPPVWCFEASVKLIYKLSNFGF